MVEESIDFYGNYKTSSVTVYFLFYLKQRNILTEVVFFIFKDLNLFPVNFELFFLDFLKLSGFTK